MAGMTAIVASTAVASNASVCPLPSGTAIGDLLIAGTGYKWGTSGGVTSWPAGWTVMYESGNGLGDTNFHQASWAWKIADANDISAGSITITPSAASTFQAIGIQRITGHDPGNPVVFAPGTSVHGTATITWPTITPSVDDVLTILGFANANSEQTDGWPAKPIGYAEDYDDSVRTAGNGSNLSCFHAPIEMAADAYTPPTGTYFSSSYTSFVITIGINPAAVVNGADVAEVATFGSGSANIVDLTVNMPPGVGGIIVMGVNGHNQPPSVDNTWTPAFTVTQDTVDGFWWKVDDGSASTHITFGGGGSNRPHGVIYRIFGADTSSPVAAFSQNGSSVAGITATAASCSPGKSTLAISWICTNNVDGITFTGTAVADAASIGGTGNAGSCATGHVTNDTNPTTAQQATLNESVTWSAYQIAIAPAATGGTDYTASPADTASLTDQTSTVVDAQRTIADLAALSDQASTALDATRDQADTLALADGVSTAVDRVVTVSDALSLTDAASTGASSVVEQTVADALNLTDGAAVSLGAVRQPADSLALSDVTTQTLDAARAVADDLALTDAVSVVMQRVVTVADLLALSDATAHDAGARNITLISARGPYGHKASSTLHGRTVTARGPHGRTISARGPHT